MHALDDFYEKTDPEFVSLRMKIREILQIEEEMTETVQLVGKVQIWSRYIYSL
jgi:V-type H+-transporting ATPase subunit A